MIKALQWVAVAIQMLGALLMTCNSMHMAFLSLSIGGAMWLALAVKTKAWPTAVLTAPFLVANITAFIRG